MGLQTLAAGVPWDGKVWALLLQSCRSAHTLDFGLEFILNKRAVLNDKLLKYIAKFILSATSQGHTSFIRPDNCNTF